VLPPSFGLIGITRSVLPICSADGLHYFDIHPLGRLVEIAFPPYLPDCCRSLLHYLTYIEAYKFPGAGYTNTPIFPSSLAPPIIMHTCTQGCECEMMSHSLLPGLYRVLFPDLHFSSFSTAFTTSWAECGLLIVS
jgi:hypothetical protein